MNLAVRRVADRVGLKLSAHVPRQAFVTGLVRAGNDVVLIAELAGHRRLETTRRYILPSREDAGRPSRMWSSTSEAPMCQVPLLIARVAPARGAVKVVRPVGRCTLTASRAGACWRSGRGRGLAVLRSRIMRR
jgi:integrase/recombinase XerC